LFGEFPETQLQIGSNSLKSEIKVLSTHQATVDLLVTCTKLLMQILFELYKLV